jgi:O-antigen/teichoic acid export membrane protein
VSDLTRKAAQGTVAHVTAWLCLSVCGYIVAVVLARSLGPEAYGVYGAVYTLLLAIELIGKLGIPQAAIKLVAERLVPAPRLEATALSLAFLVYLGLFVLVFAAAPTLAAIFDLPDGTRLFRIAAIDIPFYGVFASLLSILNGRRAFLRESSVYAFYGLSRTAAILMLVWIGPSVAGALIVNILVSVASAAMATAAVGLRVFRPTLVDRGPILRLAVPVALLTAGTQLLPALDFWVLSAVGDLPAAVKGTYMAAINAARIPGFLANALTSILVPSIAAALAAGQRETAQRTLQGAVRFMLVVLLGLCALVAANATEVMTLLFSEEYAPGGPVLAILVFAQGLFMTVLLTLCNVLFGGGRPAVAATLTLALVPVQVALTGLLVLQLGAVGAAFGTLLGAVIGVALAVVLVWRLVGPVFETRVVAGTATAAALVAFASRMFVGEGLELVAELAVAGLGYGILLLLLGVVRFDDLHILFPPRGAPQPNRAA